jgi:hypothetical protein
VFEAEDRDELGDKNDNPDGGNESTKESLRASLSVCIRDEEFRTPTHPRENRVEEAETEHSETAPQSEITGSSKAVQASSLYIREGDQSCLENDDRRDRHRQLERRGLRERTMGVRFGFDERGNRLAHDE